MNTIKINLVKNPTRTYHLSKYIPKIESAGSLELSDIVDALIEDGLETDKESVMEIIRLFNRKTTEMVLSGHEVDTELVTLQPIVIDPLFERKYKADVLFMQGVELERGITNTEVEILNEKEIAEDLKSGYDTSNKESHNGYISVTAQDPACGMAFRAWLFKS